MAPPQPPMPAPPPPQIPYQPQPPQQFSPMPTQYPPPGPIPVIGMPPPAPAKGHGWVWGIVIVGAIVYGLYYLTTHDQQNQQPNQNPQTQPQGQQPGNQPQGQQPGNQPQGQQPGGQPQGQQPGQGGAGGTDNIAQQQKFTFNPVNQNGTVEITQATWENDSNVTITSATLECAQFDAQNQIIQASIMQTTLNGPLSPGQNTTFPSFQMGQVQQGVQEVKCGIVQVVPASQ
jgi:hypothetical protein